MNNKIKNIKDIPPIKGNNMKVLPKKFTIIVVVCINANNIGVYLIRVKNILYKFLFNVLSEFVIF